MLDLAIERFFRSKEAGFRVRGYLPQRNQNWRTMNIMLS
jgi:hypothetical protein